MAKEFKIFSLNVRGIQDVNKRRELFFFLRQMNADVFILQETHSTIECEQLWNTEWGSGILYSHGTSSTLGVMLFFNKRRIAQILDVITDPGGRYICANIEVNEHIFTLATIYAPNKDSPDFFKELNRNLVKLDAADVVLIGDFNLVLHPEIDRTENKLYNNRAKTVLDNIITTYELTDIWRMKHPGIIEYSWFRLFPKFTGSRIDFVLLNNSLINRNVSCEYVQGYKTDHRGVRLVQDFCKYARGPGYWKFNNLLLHDTQYLDLVRKLIQDAKKSWIPGNSKDVWESLKTKIINETKQFGKNKAKAKREEFRKIQDKLCSIKSMLSSQPGNHILQECLKNVEDDLEVHIENKTRAAMFRSGTKWAAEGERSTKYFFALEKSNFNKKSMTRLRQTDGTVTDDPTAIMTAQVSFYSDLYTADPDVDFKLINITECRVQREDNLILCKAPQFEEVTKAMYKIAKNKAPGPDGLTAEFYCEFWAELGTLYYAALIQSLNDHEMHISARRGVISLIPKKTKDPLLLANW